MQENLLLLRFCLERNYRDRIYELDNQFHFMMFALVNRTRCFRVMRSMTAHFDRVRALNIVTMCTDKMASDHERILLSVIDRDVDSAQRYMREHLSRFNVDMLVVRQQYPQFFS